MNHHVGEGGARVDAADARERYAAIALCQDYALENPDAYADRVSVDR
jgi:hypothetical protein